MTYEQLEDQIQGLLAKAEPLRALDEDDPRCAELASIVDQINRLRAKQANLSQQAALAALNAPSEEPELTAREKLEADALRLGITFRSNISDENLRKRVEEAKP